MTSFAKWIGASTIAAAALMLLAAPVAAAERMVPETARPEFQLAQAGTGNPCAMGGGKGGGMMGGGKGGGMMGGGKGGGMMGGGMMGGGKGGGMMGGGAANPCGGKGGGKSCGMMGGGKGGGAANPCGMMGANKKSHDYKKDPYKDYTLGTVAKRLDEKLAEIKTAIEPRADQNAAFKAFADTIRNRVKPTEKMRIRLANRWKRKDKPGALERLALREDRAAVYHANISTTRRALEKLYKVLDADQKKRVDGLFARYRFHHLP